MDYSKLLNQSQLAAVTTDSQYVRIVAGAGSGKTRVLTYRISYLVSEKFVDPRRILAIAFTNKVANEMRTRAAKVLETESSFVRVMTFHSWCAYFLRQEAHQLNYPKNYTILDEDDQQDLVKSVGESFGYKKSDKIVKSSLEFIRSQKSRGKYPDDVKIPFNVPEYKEMLRFFRAYEDKKEAMFCFDFDDLLLKTIQILRENLDTRRYWANKYDHLLVDEFQDVNDTQYELLMYLNRGDNSIYVVGDPDQTIYTWRGANQKIIMNFDRTFPGAETIILDRNYRSTKKILKVANTLIAKNKNRIPKDLYTEEVEGDDVVTRKVPKAEDEASYVAREVNRLAKLQGNGVPDYRGIALLYRSSYLTRPFETEFTGRGIPHKIFGGQRFYQRREVKDVLAYLRLISNSLDDVSFERIINIPRRGLGDTAMDILKAQALENGKSLFENIDLIDVDTTEMSPRAISSFRAFKSLIEDVRAKLDEKIEIFSTTLKDFLTDIKYFEYLKENEEIEEDREANVMALFQDMDNFVSSHEGASYEEFLQNVTLLTSQDDLKDGNFVSFMTVHIAKGLEFDNVFVIGFSEGAFPNQRAIIESGSEALEEERRLAYVALTRAKKRLYITCNTGYSYVTAGNSMPSQFFTDAGLPFPREDDYSERQSNSYSYGWRNTPSTPAPSRDRAFFGDGDHLSSFNDAVEIVKVKAPEERGTNGISDWKVGDVLEHKKFGRGTVVALCGGTIIRVRFETQGEKTLAGDHPMISKISSKGGQA